jgi:hypothetical protein
VLKDTRHVAGRKGDHRGKTACTESSRKVGRQIYRPEAKRLTWKIMKGTVHYRKEGPHWQRNLNAWQGEFKVNIEGNRKLLWILD